MLKDFQSESKELISQMMSLLEECEGNPSQAKGLEHYGQLVDRIMGGAKSLAMMESNADHLIHKLGDYTAICKTVGYKASQITNNPQFFEICVALLLDATEAMDEMVKRIVDKDVKLTDFLSKTLIDRVKWVNTKFAADVRSSVDVKTTAGSKRMSQEEIDGLLKKLGLD